MTTIIPPYNNRLESASTCRLHNHPTPESILFAPFQTPNKPQAVFARDTCTDSSHCNEWNQLINKCKFDQIKFEYLKCQCGWIFTVTGDLKTFIPTLTRLQLLMFFATILHKSISKLIIIIGNSIITYSTDTLGVLSDILENNYTEKMFVTTFINISRYCHNQTTHICYTHDIVEKMKHYCVNCPNLKITFPYQSLTTYTMISKTVCANFYKTLKKQKLDASVQVLDQFDSGKKNIYQVMETFHKNNLFNVKFKKKRHNWKWSLLNYFIVLYSKQKNVNFFDSLCGDLYKSIFEFFTLREQEQIFKTLNQHFKSLFENKKINASNSKRLRLSGSQLPPLPVLSKLPPLPVLPGKQPVQQPSLTSLSEQPVQPLSQLPPLAVLSKLPPLPILPKQSAFNIGVVPQFEIGSSDTYKQSIINKFKQDKEKWPVVRDQLMHLMKKLDQSNQSFSDNSKWLQSTTVSNTVVDIISSEDAANALNIAYEQGKEMRSIKVKDKGPIKEQYKDIPYYDAGPTNTRIFFVVPQGTTKGTGKVYSPSGLDGDILTVQMSQVLTDDFHNNFGYCGQYDMADIIIIGNHCKRFDHTHLIHWVNIWMLSSYDERKKLLEEENHIYQVLQNTSNETGFKKCLEKICQMGRLQGCSCMLYPCTLEWSDYDGIDKKENESEIIDLLHNLIKPTRKGNQPNSYIMISPLYVFITLLPYYIALLTYHITLLHIM